MRDAKRKTRDYRSNESAVKRRKRDSFFNRPFGGANGNRTPTPVFSLKIVQFLNHILLQHLVRLLCHNSKISKIVCIMSIHTSMKQSTVTHN